MPVFGRKPKLWAFARSELNSVSRLEHAAGYLLAVDKCSVPTLCVFKHKLRAVVRDRSVAARDVGLRKRQVAFRGTPDHEWKVIDHDWSAVQTVDQFHGKNLSLWGFSYVHCDTRTS